MCSILIFIKPDNDHPDPSLDWQRFKVGDVIDIAEADDFHWGDDIQGPGALGWWTVVVVPNVQKAQLEYLLESGVTPFGSIAPLNPAEVKHQKRLWTVDTARVLPSMNLADFLSTVTAKPEPVNYNVIE